MLESLYGLPGKIKTLLDRLTAARAGYLDRLDNTVSSRAPASTALSNATWTDARAEYQDRLDNTVSSRAPASTALSNATWTDDRAVKVDNLDAAVSTRAPSSTALSTATWTAARATKQDNLDTTVSSRAPSSTALSTATWTAARAGYLDNLNATVSSRADGSIWTSTRAGYVDRIDTTVSSRADGSIWNSTRAGYIDTMIGRIDASISSRSTLTANDVWGAETRTVTGIPTVINSIQRGAVTFGRDSSGNITISSVNLSKSMLIISCKSGMAYSTDFVSTNVAGGYLSSSTNIAWSSGDLSSGGAPSLGTMYWQVIEFK